MRTTAFSRWSCAWPVGSPSGAAAPLNRSCSPAPGIFVGTLSRAASQRSGRTGVRPSRHASPRLRPNPLLKLTRYGRLCKASPRYPVHLRGLALQSLPPRAA